MSSSRDSLSEITPKNLFTEEEILNFLKDEEQWSSYKGNFESIHKDNRIIQENIRKFIGTDLNDINDFMKRVRFKALGQIIGMAGHATEEKALPMRAIEAIDEKTECSYLLEIPDFNSDKIINFAGWHQLEYLLYNFYFLLELYLHLKKGNLICQFEISPEVLELIIEEEIKHTINTYQIRKNCKEILDIRESNLKLPTLTAYFSKLIEEILKRDDYEYCIPVGSKGHAVYITLLYFKEDNQILIRIDNSDRKETTVLGGVKTDQAGKDLLAKYLANAASHLLTSNNEIARQEIYNEGKKFIFDKAENGYIALPEQKALNCVVEGFRRAMWYRLWEKDDTKKDTLYQWITHKSYQFAATPHFSTNDTYKRHLALRNEADEKKLKKRRLTKSNCQSPLIERVHEILKQKYLGFKEIKGLFGNPFVLEREYINLQMICHTEVEEEKDQDEEKKLTNNGRLSSYEDLFGDKRVIKPEDLFKSDHDLFPHASKKNLAPPTLLLIQGRAGIGKTTFLHYVSREWAQGKLYNQYRWVFKLTCRELRTQKFQQLNELKVWEWVYHSQFSASDINKQSFEELWGKLTQSPSWQQEVLFCIDGYDELPELSEHHPCKAVLNVLLTGEYAGVHKIITSRPYGVAKLPKERRDIEVIGFTDENITRYLQTYFPSDSFAKQLGDNLKQNPILWGIAHIPVNLNLICGIMERMQKKDLQRKVGALGSLSQLYQAMEEKLLERIYERDQETKSLKPLSTIAERRRKELLNHYQKACYFLARLAFEGMQESQIVLSRDLLNQVLEAQQIEDDREFLLQLQEIGFIKPILESAIAEDEKDYEFIHLTFQEYYAAKHIVASMQADQAQRDPMRSLIMKERYNPRWQVVWWFVAGLLRQDDKTYTEYIRLLQGQDQKRHRQDQKKFLTGDLLQHYGLGLLARCLDEGLVTNENILPVMDESISLLQARVKSLYLCAQRMNRNRAISSALIESLWLSPRLRLLSGEKDLYSRVDLVDDTPCVEGSIRPIGQLRIVTSRVLGYLAKQLANPSQVICQEAAVAVRDIESAAATPAILGKLANLLRDENNDVRWSASYAVSSLGSAVATPDFLAQLADLLSNNNYEVRGSTANAIRGIESAAATPEILGKLVNLLGDPDRHVRWSAAAAIHDIGSAAATPEVLGKLGNLLSNKNDDVRESAAEVVSNIGPEAATPAILAQLAKLLSDDNYQVCSSAAEAVRNIGSAAATSEILAQLAKLLSNENDEVRRSAAKAVSNLESAAATPDFLAQLAELLGDKNNYKVRGSAAEAVSNIGPEAATPEILAQLANLLRDSDGHVLWSAVHAVSSIEFKAATTEILTQLTKLLSDKDDGVHYNVAHAISSIGPAAATPEILAQIAKLLSDEDDGVRCNAAHAVSGIGSKAATPEILAQLDKLLSDGNDSVRRSAAKAFRSIGSKAATPEILAQLDKLLSDGNSSVRYSAAEAFRSIRSEEVTPAILAQLDRLLNDEDNDVRYSAAEAVRSIGSAAVTPEILAQLGRLLSDGNDSVRYSAAEAVRSIGSKAATPDFLAQLDNLLKDEKDHVRYSAAKAVLGIGSAAATPAILAQLAKLLSDDNDEVRYSAAEAIRSIGSEAATPEILAQLTKLLSDDNDSMCWRAAEAISAIGSEAANSEISNQLVKLMLTDSHKHWDYITQVLSTLIPAIFTDNLQQWARQPTGSSPPSDTVDISLIRVIIGAYLTGHISCQVAWDAAKQQYRVSGFVHTQGYYIPINEQQAQWLCQKVPGIIEQLSQGNISDVLLASRLNTNYSSGSHPSNSSHISRQNNPLRHFIGWANTLFNQPQKRNYPHDLVRSITVKETTAPSSSSQAVSLSRSRPNSGNQ